MATHAFQCSCISWICSTWSIGEWFFRPFRFVVLLVLVLPIQEDRVEILHAGHGQKSNTVHEACDASGSESSSGEAKEIYLVASVVVCCKESVGFADVFRNASSSTSANDVIPESTFGSNAGLVVDNLLGPIAAVWKQSTAYTSNV